MQNAFAYCESFTKIMWRMLKIIDVADAQKPDSVYLNYKKGQCLITCVGMHSIELII